MMDDIGEREDAQALASMCLDYMKRDGLRPDSEVQTVHDAYRSGYLDPFISRGRYMVYMLRQKRLGSQLANGFLEEHQISGEDRASMSGPEAEEYDRETERLNREVVVMEAEVFIPQLREYFTDFDALVRMLRRVLKVQLPADPTAAQISSELARIKTLLDERPSDPEIRAIRHEIKRFIGYHRIFNEFMTTTFTHVRVYDENMLVEHLVALVLEYLMCKEFLLHCINADDFAGEPEVELVIAALDTVFPERLRSIPERINAEIGAPVTTQFTDTATIHPSYRRLITILSNVDVRDPSAARDEIWTCLRDIDGAMANLAPGIREAFGKLQELAGLEFRRFVDNGGFMDPSILSAGTLPHRGLGHVNHAIVETLDALAYDDDFVRERGLTDAEIGSFQSFVAFNEGSDVPHERRLPLEKLRDKSEEFGELKGADSLPLQVVMLPVSEFRLSSGETFTAHLDPIENIIWVATGTKAAPRDPMDIELDIRHERGHYNLLVELLGKRGIIARPEWEAAGQDMESLISGMTFSDYEKQHEEVWRRMISNLRNQQLANVFGNMSAYSKYAQMAFRAESHLRESRAKREARSKTLGALTGDELAITSRETGAKKRILLVESAKGPALTMEALFLGEGFDVIRASSAEEGVAIIENMVSDPTAPRIDMVLTAHRIGADPEAGRRVLQKAKAVYIHAFLMTNRLQAMEETDVRRLQALGATAVWNKLDSPEALLDTVKKFSETPSVTEEFTLDFARGILPDVAPAFKTFSDLRRILRRAFKVPLPRDAGCGEVMHELKRIIRLPLSEAASDRFYREYARVVGRRELLDIFIHGVLMKYSAENEAYLESDIAAAYMQLNRVVLWYLLIRECLMRWIAQADPSKVNEAEIWLEEFGNNIPTVFDGLDDLVRGVVRPQGALLPSEITQLPEYARLIGLLTSVDTTEGLRAIHQEVQGCFAVIDRHIQAMTQNTEADFEELESRAKSEHAQFIMPDGLGGIGIGDRGLFPHRGEGHLNDCIVEDLYRSLDYLERQVSMRLKDGAISAEDAKEFMRRAELFRSWYMSDERKPGDDVPEEVRLHIDAIEDSSQNIIASNGRRLRVVRLPVNELGRIDGEPFYAHIGLREGIIWVAVGEEHDPRYHASIAVEILHESEEYNLALSLAEELGCTMDELISLRDGQEATGTQVAGGGIIEILQSFRRNHIEAWRRVAGYCYGEVTRLDGILKTAPKADRDRLKKEIGRYVLMARTAERYFTIASTINTEAVTPETIAWGGGIVSDSDDFLERLQSADRLYQDMADGLHVYIASLGKHYLVDSGGIVYDLSSGRKVNLSDDPSYDRELAALVTDEYQRRVIGYIKKHSVIQFARLIWGGRIESYREAVANIKRVLPFLRDEERPEALAGAANGLVKQMDDFLAEAKRVTGLPEYAFSGTRAEQLQGLKRNLKRFGPVENLEQMHERLKEAKALKDRAEVLQRDIDTAEELYFYEVSVLEQNPRLGRIKMDLFSYCLIREGMMRWAMGDRAHLANEASIWFDYFAKYLPRRFERLDRFLDRGNTFSQMVSSAPYRTLVTLLAGIGKQTRTLNHPTQAAILNAIVLIDATMTATYSDGIALIEELNMRAKAEFTGTSTARAQQAAVTEIFPHRGEEGRVNNSIVEILYNNLDHFQRRAESLLASGETQGYDEEYRNFGEYAERFRRWHDGEARRGRQYVGQVRRAGDDVPSEAMLPIPVLRDRGWTLYDITARSLQVVMLPVNEITRIGDQAVYAHLSLRDGIIWVATGAPESRRDEIDIDLDVYHNLQEYNLALIYARDVLNQDIGNNRRETMTTVARIRDKGPNTHDREEVQQRFYRHHVASWRIVRASLDEELSSGRLGRDRYERMCSRVDQRISALRGTEVAPLRPVDGGFAITSVDSDKAEPSAYMPEQRQEWAKQLANGARDRVGALPPDGRLGLVVDTSIGNWGKYGGDLVREIEEMAQREGFNGRLDILIGEGSELLARVNQYLGDNPNARVRGVIHKKDQRNYSKKFERKESLKERIRVVAVDDEGVKNANSKALHYIPMLPIIEISLSENVRHLPYTHTTRGPDSGIIISNIILMLPSVDPVTPQELESRFTEDAAFLNDA